ncbi:MAG TPA: AraC family transcriptional regulator [Burkholderiales bacterium]
MHAQLPTPLPLNRGPLRTAKSGAVDFSSVRPESVQLSSRSLGWKLLNFERREVGPSFRDLPEGATEHLVFVSLGGGVLERQSAEGKAKHQLAPGFVAVVPAGHAVRWAWNSRISFSLLALKPEFLQQVAQQHLGLEWDQVQLRFAEREQDPAIATIAAALAREAVRGDAGSRVYAESLANILAVHLLRNYAASAGLDQQALPASVPRAVSRALSFIQQNHASDISLADIAAAAHMSPFHFTRLFKRAIGVAPYQYLIQMRVNSARALITAGGGGYSLAEIATSVGFADQSHLTRHFKKVLGVTPKQMAH